MISENSEAHDQDRMAHDCRGESGMCAIVSAAALSSCPDT